MKLFKFLFVSLFLLVCYSFIPKEGLDCIIKHGDKVKLLADGFLFTEGPASDGKGNIYFTDQPNDRIMLWGKDGKLSVFLQPAGRSNGLSFDDKGNLWACADEKNALWCIDPVKNITIIPSRYKGKALNGPNDLWNTPDGGVYFTDPFYKRTWWDHDSMPQPIQAVYFLSPDHKTITRVADDLKQPNGIVGTPDGTTLFVADIQANKTWKYTINKDGTLSNKRLFCEMGSDGMTIDLKGNIYLTGTGVTVFDRDGVFLGTIPVPEKWTANVCFGGKDMKTLFITASKSFYSIRTLTKGAC
jgi:gluconolactonase